MPKSQPITKRVCVLDEKTGLPKFTLEVVGHRTTRLRSWVWLALCPVYAAVAFWVMLEFVSK